MVLSCNIFEIKRDIGRKLQIFHTTPLSTALTFATEKNRMVDLSDQTVEKKLENIKFTRFSGLHERDRRTDVQTERHRAMA